jgi:hypothetical protein
MTTQLQLVVVVVVVRVVIKLPTTQCNIPEDHNSLPVALPCSHKYQDSASTVLKTVWLIVI